MLLLMLFTNNISNNLNPLKFSHESWNAEPSFSLTLVYAFLLSHFKQIIQKCIMRSSKIEISKQIGQSGGAFSSTPAVAKSTETKIIVYILWESFKSIP